MPLCAPYNNTTTPCFPATYPTDMVILLTSKILPGNGTGVPDSLYEYDLPLVGRGGPQNVTYRGIMTNDAYFELYKKEAEITESSGLTNNTLTEEEEDLGTLVWRFGRPSREQGLAFEQGVARISMQLDGNLVIYTTNPDNFIVVASITRNRREFDESKYDNHYLAWIPKENQAAVFPGYWDEGLPRLWSSSQGPSNELPYTLEEYNILNPCQRISSALSIVGSTLVFYMIVGQWIKRKKWSGTRDRILVGVCILDLFFSVGFMIATAATPPEFGGVVGANGSVGFCDAQGFMIQLGMSVPLYYCGLSLVFLLYVIKGKRIRSVETRVEPMIHFLVWAVAISTSITGLVLEVYNSNGQFCYIKPYPYNCEFSSFDCTRGAAGITLVWYFSALLVGIPYLGTIILMIALYYAVWDQDRKLKQRYGNLWNGNMDRLKKIKVQAFLYIGGFFMVWFWTSIRSLLLAIGIESPFWLEVASSFTLPLQGFLNFVIFVRQPISQTKKDHPEMPTLRLIVKAIKDYPFVNPDQRINRSRRSFRSQRGMDLSERGMDRSQRGVDSSQRGASQKNLDRSQKSSDSGENFFSSSRLFVLGKDKDQEGAC